MPLPAYAITRAHSCESRKITHCRVA